MIHLPKIRKLNGLYLSNKRCFPKISAIYFAFVGEELIYVGRASNLQNRFKNHQKFKNMNHEIILIRWLPTQNLEIEPCYIKKFRPLLNIAIYENTVPLKSKNKSLMNLKNNNKVRYGIAIPAHLENKADALKPYFSAFIARCLSDNKRIVEFKKNLFYKNVPEIGCPPSRGLSGGK